MNWDLFLQLEFLIITLALAASIVKATNPGKAKDSAED